MLEVLDLVTSGLTFATFMLAVFQLKKLEKQITAQHDWNRRSKACEYSFSDDPQILQILTRLDFHLKVSSQKSFGISFEEIEEKRKVYPEIKLDIHFALARLEAMCVAVQNGVADEQLCIELFRNRTISFYRFFQNYIEEIREKRGTNTLFITLEKYAHRWQKGDYPPPRPETA